MQIQRGVTPVLPVLLSKESYSSFVGGASSGLAQIEKFPTIPILEVGGHE